MKLFRLVSLIEGCSLLALLFVAMPLKYYAGMPEPVFYVGMTHGILFLLYAGMALGVSHLQGWSIGYWLLIFLLGVIPFGFLVVDHRLRRTMHPQLAAEAG
ncbi:MAG TPA: DUF3817 domain-containing protein [Thioalkalivibrio sp.]|nr:DUF3817 domain-containing protein [Thioalkalivibrio sp.]